MGSYVLFQNSFDSDTWTGVALSKTRFRYRAVAVGGTFDILHIGHEKLLAKAFELGELVFVGVTGDQLVSKLNKDHPVRTFAVRRRIEAVVVSEETRENGLRLNQLRRNRGLKPLRLYVVRMVRADDGKVVSDSRIRRGEVNPRGRLKKRVRTRIR